MKFEERKEENQDGFNNNVRRIIYSISQNNQQIQACERRNADLRTALAKLEFEDIEDIDLK